MEEARQPAAVSAPAVSVLTPAWRAEATIAATAASVLVQDVALEMVIAADDDRDYAAILAGAGIADPRIRILAAPAHGTGPSAARNRALAAARGQFVAPLDADDRFETGRLAALLPLAERCGAAVDGSRAEDDAGRPHGVSFPPGTAPDFAGILSVAVPVFPVFRRALLPRDAWDERLRFAEDVLFNAVLWSRLGGEERRGFAIADRPMLRYAVRADSLSHALEATAAAEATYTSLLGRVDVLPIAPALRAVFAATIERKRAVNRAFAAAQAKEPGLTFQQFADELDQFRHPRGGEDPSGR
jgi:succinoglycan biosynthesis protein ExoO